MTLLFIIVAVPIIWIGACSLVGWAIRRSWSPVQPGEEFTICSRCGGPCPVRPFNRCKGGKWECMKCL